MRFKISMKNPTSGPASSNFAATPVLQIIKGVISNYRCVRQSANFVFFESDKYALGVVAIAASLVGSSGLAAGTAVTATAEEEADFVGFMLGNLAVQGWVWRSPFQDGDEVEIVAARQGDKYEAFAIARPKDRMVALYPHCLRGRTRHWIVVAKWWLVGSVISMLMGVFLFLVNWMITSSTWGDTVRNLSMLPGVALILLPFFLIMAVSLGWKRMSFVRLAEKIFAKFGWENAHSIDLKKISGACQSSSESVDYGVFFFRY